MSTLRRLMGSLTLLTFCTSFAFNRASLDRIRQEEAALHSRRIDWLKRQLDRELAFLSSARQATSTSTSWGWASSSSNQAVTRSDSVDLDLIRQSLALSLDPISLGFPPHLVTQLTSLVSRTQQVGKTSWSRALFGDVNAIGTSVRQARIRAKQALFGGDKVREEEQLSQEEMERRSKQEEEEEKRIREWEKNMLEAEAAAAEVASRPAPTPPPTTMAAPARASPPPPPIYSTSPIMQSSSSSSTTTRSSGSPSLQKGAGAQAQADQNQTKQATESSSGGARRFYI